MIAAAISWSPSPGRSRSSLRRRRRSACGWLLPGDARSAALRGYRETKRARALARNALLRIVWPLAHALHLLRAALAGRRVEEQTSPQLLDAGEPLGLSPDEFLGLNIALALCGARLRGRCSISRRMLGTALLRRLLRARRRDDADDVAVGDGAGAPQVDQPRPAASARPRRHGDGRRPRLHRRGRARRRQVERQARSAVRRAVALPATICMLGKTRREALEDLAERAPTELVKAFVAAAIQAEKRGTPLVEVLAIQADVARTQALPDAPRRSRGAPACWSCCRSCSSSPPAARDVRQRHRQSAARAAVVSARSRSFPFVVAVSLYDTGRGASSCSIRRGARRAQRRGRLCASRIAAFRGGSSPSSASSRRRLLGRPRFRIVPHAAKNPLYVNGVAGRRGQPRLRRRRRGRRGAARPAQGARAARRRRLTPMRVGHRASPALHDARAGGAGARSAPPPPTLRDAAAGQAVRQPAARRLQRSGHLQRARAHRVSARQELRQAGGRGAGRAGTTPAIELYRAAEFERLSGRRAAGARDGARRSARRRHLGGAASTTTLQFRLARDLRANDADALRETIAAAGGRGARRAHPMRVQLDQYLRDHPLPKKD